jgi:hypothetical protein
MSSFDPPAVTPASGKPPNQRSSAGTSRAPGRRRPWAIGMVVVAGLALIGAHLGDQKGGDGPHDVCCTMTPADPARSPTPPAVDAGSPSNDPGLLPQNADPNWYPCAGGGCAVPGLPAFVPGGGLALP